MAKSGKHGPASTIGAKLAEHEVRKESNQGNFCLKCGAWKGELGLEPTIELYIEYLILIFNEVKRVLKKTGTCFVNIDDSYAGSGGAHNENNANPGLSKSFERGGAPHHGNLGIPSRYLAPKGMSAKSLCLIPSRFALAMVNSGWILRNDIVWDKPNPMSESVKDRFTGSWEHLFFFVKSQRYFFEQQLEAYTEPLNRWGGPTLKRETEKTQEYKDMLNLSPSSALRAGNAIRPNELGRNKRDVWGITTQPYPEAHFATFPEKLCETPILAGCPSHVCKKCGKAREKTYGDSEWESHQTEGMAALDTPDSPMYRGGHHNDGLPYRANLKDKGYTDCGCNAGFKPGVVLDPFCGSGKALSVAKRLGRKAIGIDLNPDYCKLAVKEIQKIPIPMELI